MDEIIVFSKEILEHSLKELSSEFSYLAYPLGLLDYEVGEIDGKAFTNGKKAILSGQRIVEITAEKGVKEVGTVILHTLMHCLFCIRLKTKKVRWHMI